MEQLISWTPPRGKAIAALSLALGGLAMGSVPAIADPPAVYYAWRSLTITPTACVTEARRALEQQALQSIQVSGNSVSGRSAATTAVLMCLEQDFDTMTVMVVVSSQDDAAAVALREALKDQF